MLVAHDGHSLGLQGRSGGFAHSDSQIDYEQERVVATGMDEAE
jgi:hypothetical protein